MLSVAFYASLLLPVAVCLSAGAGESSNVQVETRGASALGLTATNVSGAVHPHGRATEFHFEYGPTTSYGSATTLAALPPRLARSAKYAASTLARSLDILHVAAALPLGARVFVSFDDRQRKLARRARLKVLPRIRP